MLFTIQCIDGLYFHNGGRIILFNSDKEASGFLNMYIQYATNRLANEGKVEDLMRASLTINSECKIVPVIFDVGQVECGTVYAEELFKNK